MAKHHRLSKTWRSDFLQVRMELCLDQKDTIQEFPDYLVLILFIGRFEGGEFLFRLLVDIGLVSLGDTLVL